MAIIKSIYLVGIRGVLFLTRFTYTLPCSATDLLFICFTTALHLSIAAYRSINLYKGNICAMAIHLQFLSHVCAVYSTLK